MATTQALKMFGNGLMKAGPYVLLEIILPGGTLFALLLFLYRREQARNGGKPPRLNVVVGRALDDLHRRCPVCIELHGIASTWRGRKEERDGLEVMAMTPAR